MTEEQKGVSQEKNTSLDEFIKTLECNLLMKRGEDVYYRTVLDRVEKAIIGFALNPTFGNQLRAAKVLGINRNTLRSKIKISK